MKVLNSFETSAEVKVELSPSFLEEISEVLE